MNTQPLMTDKEIMDDILSSQKAITGVYNIYSNECAHQCLRDDFLNILRDEHNIQSNVFNQMQQRGWYAPPAAEQKNIDEVKTKFQNIASTL